MKDGRSSPYLAYDSPAQPASTSAKRRLRTPRYSAFELRRVLAPALLIDALLIVATGLMIGTVYHLFFYQTPGDLYEYLGTSTIVAAGYLSVTGLTVSQNAPSSGSISDQARDAVLSWCIAFSLFLGIAFALKLGDMLSRGSAASFFVLGLIVVVVSRLNLPPLLLRALSAAGFDSQDVILVGAVGDSVLERLASETSGKICAEPVVITFNASCIANAWPQERKLLASRIADVARTAGNGQIIVSAGKIPQQRLDSVLRSLNQIPRAVVIVPDELTSHYLLRPITTVGTQVAIEFQKEPMSLIERWIKRGFDIVSAAVAIGLLLPLFAMVALAIKLDSPGQVLFLQHRKGRGGRPFKIVKFRTMTVCEDNVDVVQATRNDPRVTRVGAFLRKTSIDELPQLFCVLKGDMSLIGPRPHALAHDDLYSKLIESYELRQHVRPGITGWAQVNGLRGETKTLDLMYRRVEYDIWYSTNCTLLLDLKILVRTVVQVLLRREAY